MASLSLVGWFNGLSASGLVIFGIIFGLYIIYKARKSNAQLLYIIGLVIIFAGLGWLGNLVDFITILLTGQNMDNSSGTYILLSMMWFPLTVLCTMYVGAELLIPSKKWYFVSIYVILGVLFEIFLFLDPFGSYAFSYPSPSGSDLIDEGLIYSSPVGIIMIIFILSEVVFWGFGFIYKAIQSTGRVRMNFLIVSLGSFMFLIFGVLDNLGFPGIALVFFRIGILSSMWLMYFGFFRHLGSRE